MTNFASRQSEWEPFGLASGLRGVVAVAGMALLLAACGQGQGPSSSAPAKGAAPKASAPATSAPSTASTTQPAALPAHASTAAQAAEQKAEAAQAKLASMSVADLLTAAREAYAQHRLVAPAGDNAMEYYEAVLEKEPHNQVALDALREIFPFAVPDVEKAITGNDFAEADREIGLLTKADSTNYTLTLLRSKLDAQKKLLVRQQQEQEQKAQRAADEAAAKAAAAKAAADAAAKAAAESKAAQAAQAAKPPPPKPAAATPPPPPPKPEGETRAAQPISQAAPEYPIQAARNQTSGYAVVEFTVEVDGSVSNPHVVDSSPRHVFDTAAEQAVRKSKFKPALKNGEPVKSTVRRRIDFKFGG